MSLIIKRAGSAQELEDARAIRRQVFVQEQGVPQEMETDALDAAALHAVALSDGVVVGTGRLILSIPGCGIIGRMAVAQPLRRLGVGGKILSFLEEQARAQRVPRITLHAQSYVKEFYARHGYREEGKPFMEAGILHVQMFKELG
ncbi:MAG: GNAT family N-acetyltransferase [Dehalococcoidia bacterium]|nr:GNAT family N-acetyltransferase [Dehalococcoidia bacterium]